MKLLPKLVSQFTSRKDVFIIESTFCKMSQYETLQQWYFCVHHKFCDILYLSKGTFLLFYQLHRHFSSTNIFFLPPISKTADSKETNYEESDRKVNQCVFLYILQFEIWLSTIVCTLADSGFFLDC